MTSQFAHGKQRLSVGLRKQLRQRAVNMRKRALRKQSAIQQSRNSTLSKEHRIYFTTRQAIREGSKQDAEFLLEMYGLHYGKGESYQHLAMMLEEMQQ